VTDACPMVWVQFEDFENERRLKKIERTKHKRAKNQPKQIISAGWQPNELGPAQESRTSRPRQKTIVEMLKPAPVERKQTACGQFDIYNNSSSTKSSSCDRASGPKSVPGCIQGPKLAPDPEWKCFVCTYNNLSTSNKCEMCNTGKSLVGPTSESEGEEAESESNSFALLRREMEKLQLQTEHLIQKRTSNPVYHATV
jgi:hypothetical protein